MLVFGKVLWMDNQTNGRILVSLELLCDMCFLIIDGLVKKIKIIIVEENFWISILLDVRNWNKINVLTSNFILLGAQLSFELAWYHGLFLFLWYTRPWTIDMISYYHTWHQAGTPQHPAQLSISDSYVFRIPINKLIQYHHIYGQRWYLSQHGLLEMHFVLIWKDVF